MAKRQPKKFRILLTKTAGGKEIILEGHAMKVNHRGDLLICGTANDYSENCSACFRSGSWQQATTEVEDQP